MDSFDRYKAQARADLTRDSNLDKASDLLAERNVLLTDDSIPDALKRAQLKQLNRQVWTWTKKVRQPFSGEVSQVGQDTATDPTKALVHALVKKLKEEPKEEMLEAKTPANVKPPKPRNVLTPKPTPTPRRPLPKIPATPLSGVTALPETKKFDRILNRSEKHFDLIKQKYDRLTNPYKDESGPPSKKKKEAPHKDQGSSESGPPKKKKKETLGKAVKRGLKKGLEEGAKQWLDF